MYVCLFVCIDMNVLLCIFEFVFDDGAENERCTDGQADYESYQINKNDRTLRRSAIL